MEAASAVLVLGGGVQDTIPLLHAYPALVGKLYHVRTACCHVTRTSHSPPQPPPSPRGVLSAMPRAPRTCPCHTTVTITGSYT